MNPDNDVKAKLAENRSRFQALLEDCIANYLSTQVGDEHRGMYSAGRAQAGEYWPQVVAAEQSGDEITDLVLDKLIAHPNFKNKPQDHLWIHPSAARRANLKGFYKKFINED